MNRTQRLSRVLRRYASVVLWVCILLLVFSPGIVFIDGFAVDMANHLLRLIDIDAFRFSASHLGGLLRTFVWALCAVSLTIAVLSLGALIRLLHQFEGGTAFSQESIRLVRFLGWVQMAAVPIGLSMSLGLAVVAKALLGQTIHLWKQTGIYSLDGLFWGGVTLLIAHMLEEGCRLKSEQDLVI